MKKQNKRPNLFDHSFDVFLQKNPASWNSSRSRLMKRNSLDWTQRGAATVVGVFVFLMFPQVPMFFSNVFPFVGHRYIPLWFFMAPHVLPCFLCYINTSYQFSSFLGMGPTPHCSPFKGLSWVFKGVLGLWPTTIWLLSGQLACIPASSWRGSSPIKTLFEQIITC